MIDPQSTDTPDLTCNDCSKTGPDVTSGPCPYASDVHGDDTPVNLCPECSHNRAQDI